MFNNVYIIQFDNLPNPKEACKYIQTWMHVQARGKRGGGCDLGWPVYVNCPISNNHIMKIFFKKMASPDIRDSMQKLHVYDNFIIISIKIQSFF